MSDLKIDHTIRNANQAIASADSASMDLARRKIQAILDSKFVLSIGTEIVLFALLAILVAA